MKKILVIVIVLGSLVAGSVFAYDLTGKFGVGARVSYPLVVGGSLKGFSNNFSAYELFVGSTIDSPTWQVGFMLYPLAKAAWNSLQAKI